MSWEEIGLSGGVKGAVLAESQAGDFFGTVSEASSCLSAGLLFPSAGITRIAARQQDTWRTPREAGDHLAEGLCCGHSPGTSVSPWEGAGRGLSDMVQRWDTSLWAAFSAPTMDCSDMGHWKAATMEGLA